VVRIYTRKGDSGTTGLYFGGRVAKTAPPIEANGAVDEAQAVMGLARAEAGRPSELDDLLVALERDLWVLMAEVATSPDNRSKLVPGKTMVSASMVEALEGQIDRITQSTTMPSEFLVPGENRVSALLDVARTVVRRAERLVVGAVPPADSLAAAYLNRLSDLLWTMARWQEDEHPTARQAGGLPSDPASSDSATTDRAPLGSGTTDRAVTDEEGR